MQAMRTGGGSWVVTGGTHGIDKKGRGKGLLDGVVSDMMFSVEYLTENPPEGWNVEKEVLKRCFEVQMQACQDCRWRWLSLWSGRRGINWKAGKVHLLAHFGYVYWPRATCKEVLMAKPGTG